MLTFPLTYTTAMCTCISSATAKLLFYLLHRVTRWIYCLVIGELRESV